MRRILLWLGSLLGLLILIVGALAALGSSKVNKQYDVEPEEMAVSQDTAVLNRGQYLVSVNCTGCHGDDLGGTPFFQDPALGTIPAPNLTSGQGGAAAVYSDADWVRAIRHGIDPDGKPLMIMPSAAFWHYSDADLAAIIAYLQSAPPVDATWEPRQLGLMGRVLVGAGALDVLDVLAAAHIDHAAPRPAAPAPAVTAAYGEYIVNTTDCRSCHGANLAGGQSSEPGAPPAPSLAPDGSLAGWSAADFITTMRTGVTPMGLMLNPDFMPWEDYGRMTDDDLTALFLYLQSLPAAVSTTE